MVMKQTDVDGMLCNGKWRRISAHPFGSGYAWAATGEQERTRHVTRDNDDEDGFCYWHFYKHEA